MRVFNLRDRVWKFGMEIDGRASFVDLTFDQIANLHGFVVEANSPRHEADL